MGNKPKKIKKYFQIISGFSCLIIIAIFIIFSDYLSSPFSMNLSNRLSLIFSDNHLLGTDQFGRDLFARIVRGSQASITIGLLSSTIAIVIGTCMGLLSGYHGKYIDLLIMRTIDIIQGFPALLILIALSLLLPPHNITTICIIGFVSWTGIARLIRAEMIVIKTQDYIIAAQSFGYSTSRTIIKHILPNCFASIIILYTLNIGNAIMYEASLAFLGMGILPPEPSLGRMINEGKDFLRIAPHISIYPGIALSIIVLGFNLIGEGLRDASDVRFK